MACIFEDTHQGLSTTDQSWAADPFQVICNTQLSFGPIATVTVWS